MSPLILAFEFLVRTLFDLTIFLFVTRFVLQWVRADFFNPLSQMILKITNPVLMPLKRFSISIRGADSACLLVIILLTAIKSIALSWLEFQKIPGILGLSLWVLGDILTMLLHFFFYAIIIQVIISWINPGQYNPFTMLLQQITTPLMRPVRRFVPPLAGFDITPIPVLIGLQLLIILIAAPLTQIGLAWAFS